MSPAPLMTTDEYLQTPEALRPQELIYGVLRCADSPTPRHQTAVLAFTLALAPFVRKHVLGQIYVSPIDVILDDRRHLVVQPDLLFISTFRLGIVKDRIRGAPDLVIEVLSPKPRIGQLDERLGWFAEYGVRECWLLHQLRRQLEVVHFRQRAIGNRQVFDERTPIRSSVLPEFDRTLDSILSEQDEGIAGARISVADYDGR